VSIAETIEQLRQSSPEMSPEFKEQLERARAAREQMREPAPVKGIDRSGEFTPVTRPTIVRAVVVAEGYPERD
jgi:hypothetical protein